MPQKLTPEIILAAISGFEAQKSQIDVQIAQLRSLLDGHGRGSAVTSSETGKSKRKRFSLASRRKMAAAQKARWQKLKQGSEPTQTESANPKKRKLSAASRKAISIAAKKRWAAIKSMPAVAKKPGRKKAATVVA